MPEKDRRRDNPLLVDDVLLYPNLGEPVSKASKEVAFYFAVYPAQGGPPAASMIELLLNGQPVARVPVALAAPDASGRIQQAGRLPIGELAPGTYELRAVVTQGAERVVGFTMLRVVE
jgi:hypothetical protein